MFGKSYPLGALLSLALLPFGVAAALAGPASNGRCGPKMAVSTGHEHQAAACCAVKAPDCCVQQKDCCAAKKDCCAAGKQADCCASGKKDCCAGKSAPGGRQACCADQKECCAAKKDCCRAPAKAACCGGDASCCGSGKAARAEHGSVTPRAADTAACAVTRLARAQCCATKASPNPPCCQKDCDVR